MQPFTVTVTAVVGPPVIVPFDPIEFLEDTVYELDLSGHAVDDEPPDTPKGKIMWSADSTEHLTIAIKGFSAIVTPALDWHGSEPIPLKVSDGEGASSETRLQVTVLSDPEPLDFKDFSVEFEENQEIAVNLAQYITDDDTPADQMIWSIVHPDEHIDARFSGTIATFSSRTPDWSGERTLTLQVTDSDNRFDDASVTVKVTFVDDPPFFSDWQIIDSGPAANRKIQFRLRDDTGGVSHVRAFYGDARTPCVLVGMDKEGWIPVELADKRDGVNVELIWFAGLGQLTDTVIDNLVVELEARDAKNKVGQLLIGNYRLDNRGKVSPTLQVQETHRSSEEVAISLRLARTVRPTTPWQIQVRFRQRDTPGSPWQPASIKLPDENIQSGTLMGFSGALSLTWLTWLDVPVVKTTGYSGVYELQWTPVISGTPVGPTIITTHSVSANKAKPDLIILPKSRIITPAYAGHHDILSVLFRPNGVRDLKFVIYDLGGFLIYDATAPPEQLAGGWRQYTWNGRAANRSGGKLAEDGIYVFLLVIDGQVKKGTFALAR